MHAVGDAVKPRNVFDASHEAADVAELIRLRVAEDMGIAAGRS